MYICYIYNVIYNIYITYIHIHFIYMYYIYALYRLCLIDFTILVNGNQFMMMRSAKMKTEVTSKLPWSTKILKEVYKSHFYICIQMGVRDLPYPIFTNKFKKLKVTSSKKLFYTK